MFFLDITPELNASIESVQLEGECPSLRVVVEVFKDVVAGCVGPLTDRFRDDWNL